MPSLNLMVSPANMQFALVLLYSVLARNKPGMDPVVSVLCMLRMLRQNAAAPAATAQAHHFELFLQVPAATPLAPLLHRPSSLRAWLSCCW